jgi:hypothetical protein
MKEYPVNSASGRILPGGQESERLRNTGVREDQRERYSVVWEYVPFQFTQVRAGVRKSKGIPQNDAQNATEVFLQWRAFF